MKLNRKMEYALIALKHMQGKKNGDLTSAKEVSDFYGCSFDVVSRVMQRLANSGILKSVQGAQGGYKITRDLNQIPVYELNTVVMGDLEIVKCLEGGAGCELRHSCNIIAPVNRLNHRLKQFFLSFSVAELLSTDASVETKLETVL